MENSNQINRIDEIIYNISQEVTNLREYNDLVEKLQSQIRELKSNTEKLKREIALQKVDRTFIKTEESPSDLKNQNIGKFGLINLSRLNEEAVFDAINKFNKSCPYCGKDLYDGNIRRKIEIDHFFPISRGGQDFPWNILPSCKDCNRKKGNKMPYDFLLPERYNECLNYLMEVQKKITLANDDKIQRSELTNSMLIKYLEKSISKDTLLNEILLIFRLNPINHSHKTNYKDFSLSLVRDFFDYIKEENTKFIEYQGLDDRIIFSIAEAIKVYEEKVSNKSKRIDLLLIRRIFRSELPFVIEYGKVMKMRSKTSRCIILSYTKMDDEWKNTFDLLLTKHKSIELA